MKLFNSKKTVTSEQKADNGWNLPLSSLWQNKVQFFWVIVFIIATICRDPPPTQALPQVASCGTQNCLLVAHFAQF